MLLVQDTGCNCARPAPSAGLSSLCRKFSVPSLRKCKNCSATGTPGAAAARAPPLQHLCSTPNPDQLEISAPQAPPGATAARAPPWPPSAAAHALNPNPQALKHTWRRCSRSSLAASRAAWTSLARRAAFSSLADCCRRRASELRLQQFSLGFQGMHHDATLKRCRGSLSQVCCCNAGGKVGVEKGKRAICSHRTRCWICCMHAGTGPPSNVPTVSPGLPQPGAAHCRLLCAMQLTWSARPGHPSCVPSGGAPACPFRCPGDRQSQSRRCPCCHLQRTTRTYTGA